MSSNENAEPAAPAEGAPAPESAPAAPAAPPASAEDRLAKIEAFLEKYGPRFVALLGE